MPQRIGEAALDAITDDHTRSGGGSGEEAGGGGGR
jgi:hypothetical protein